MKVFLPEKTVAIASLPVKEIKFKGSTTGEVVPTLEEQYWELFRTGCTINLEIRDDAGRFHKVFSLQHPKSSRVTFFALTPRSGYFCDELADLYNKEGYSLRSVEGTFLVFLYSGEIFQNQDGRWIEI